MAANPIPTGYENAIPYLCCRNAAELLEFYQQAFGAKEAYRLRMPDGKIGHAEIEIGTARVMLSDEFPEWGNLSPKTLGGTGGNVMIYVEDVDAFCRRAEAAGAQIHMPPTTHFYGDRSCKLIDPSGHVWVFATHVEDVSPEEMQKRCDAEFGG
ncbi:MAG TPA: VOC family protein [Chthoniobacterales bacterium]